MSNIEISPPPHHIRARPKAFWSSSILATHLISFAAVPTPRSTSFFLDAVSLLPSSAPAVCSGLGSSAVASSSPYRVLAEVISPFLYLMVCNSARCRRSTRFYWTTIRVDRFGKKKAFFPPLACRYYTRTQPQHTIFWLGYQLDFF